MCAIAGIINENGPVDAMALGRFVDSMTHRGPDGRGVWVGRNAGLAHRRLAILDTDARSNCPMEYTSPYGRRIVLTYNGEVYNFLELRDELEELGYYFRTEGDSEVVAAAFCAWGSDCLKKFNGMWALAVWEASEQMLFLARDRYGVKPLHLLEQPGRIVFASESKAFRCLEGFRVEMDEEAAALTLADVFPLEASGRTLLRGVRTLPAGHFASWQRGDLRITRWWNTAKELVQVPRSLEGQAAEFGRLFEDAVRLRMRSDVPVGTCLSGGFDSTAVVCAVARAAQAGGNRSAGDWQRAFSAVFPGAANDETASARLAAQEAGVKLQECDFTASDPLEDLEKVLNDFEGFYLTLPTPIWRIYREVHHGGVLVSLDGHGADEALGAYKQADYTMFHDTPSMLTAPQETVRRLREFASAPCDPTGLISAGWGQSLNAAWRYHPSLAIPRAITRPVERFFHKRARRAGVISPRDFLFDPVRKLIPYGAFTSFAEKDVLPAHWKPLDRELYKMFHSTILPTLLRNYDRMSMAHGVEVRMPFMDWRLVQFAFSLPAASKVGGTMTKRVARMALAGKMPEEIRASRVKIGFNAPMAELMTTNFRDFVESVLPKKHDLLDIPRIRQTIAGSDRGGTWHTNAGKVWTAVHFLWFEKNFFRQPS